MYITSNFMFFSVSVVVWAVKFRFHFKFFGNFVSDIRMPYLKIYSTTISKKYYIYLGY